MDSTVICVIISAVVGPLCLLVAGAMVKHWEKKQEKRLRDNEEEKNRAYETLKKERREEIKEVVEEVIEPLKKDIDSVKSQLSLSNTATVANLRATMKSLRDYYKKQGYADIGDKATWKELYNDYKNLGGNHFKEYVNQWLEDVMDLPDEKE